MGVGLGGRGHSRGEQWGKNWDNCNRTTIKNTYQFLGPVPEVYIQLNWVVPRQLYTFGKLLF